MRSHTTRNMRLLDYPPRRRLDAWLIRNTWMPAGLLAASALLAVVAI